MHQSWLTAARGIGIVALYVWSLWRLFRTSSGNRVIQSGSLALLVFVALAVLIKFPKTPDWVLGSVGMLLLLLCLLTMAFLFQQGYRGIRRRLSKSD